MEKKLNILLLNHYAGSIDMGMEFRPYYLAKIWASRGHNVTIIASDFSHLRQKNPIIQHDFDEQIVDGIRYCWVHTKRYQGNGINRAIGMLQFVGKTFINAKSLCKLLKPDVVIASSTYPMDGYAARRIRKICNAKYIHEIHDMWPATLIELGGMSKLNPFVVLNQISENAFCKKADAVVSIPPSTKSYLIHHGMQPEKFNHIPNGIVEDDWSNSSSLPAEHQNMLKELKNKGKFIIAFTGSHNEAYGISYLIEAIRMLNKAEVCAVFVGNGNIKEKLVQQTQNEREQFLFLPPISKTAIPTFLNQVDAIYVSGIKDNLFKFGISMNKLTDAMMAGKPILYAVNAPNNYIKDYKCGLSCPPRESKALADNISKLISMPSDERNVMGENGRNAALNHFEYKIIANQFLDLMKK